MIMCDIDGTITKKPDDGLIDFTSIECIPNLDVINFLIAAQEKAHEPVLFFTKRGEIYRRNTYALIKSLFPDEFSFIVYGRNIYLDNYITLPTYKFKLEMFSYYMIKKDQITLYIEDDINTVNAFNEIGIFTVTPDIISTHLKLKKAFS
jgi:hypothetical protein